MKLLDTTEQLIAMRSSNTELNHGQAIDKFRKELYDGFPINLISLPEVKYDSKNDRYTLNFVYQGGQKHSLKCSNEVAAFIVNNLSIIGAGKHIYYGFKMVDGIVTDAVAESW